MAIIHVNSFLEGLLRLLQVLTLVYGDVAHLCVCVCVRSAVHCICRWHVPQLMQHHYEHEKPHRNHASLGKVFRGLSLRLSRKPHTVTYNLMRACSN